MTGINSFDYLFSCTNQHSHSCRQKVGEWHSPFKKYGNDVPLNLCATVLATLQNTDQFLNSFHQEDSTVTVKDDTTPRVVSHRCLNEVFGNSNSQ